jgi:threonyl-tRNA synthetase
MLEEAKKRDHRKLGRQLGLFMFDEAVGAGLPIYLPKGGVLRATLEEFERKEHLKRGYDIVYGPTLLKRDMWVKSGHIANYAENMYFTEIDEVKFGIKPMNCVNHIIIYQSELRSYRDLPIRLFELGGVHRHEKSGALHGLMRVRAFTQDDAHVFCREDQLEDEIVKILDFVGDVMNLFGFEFAHTLSTKPKEKFIGSDENWNLATDALRSAMDHKGIKYTINEGDGAFYGPKIDIKLKDAIGREWQCATIQCDFNLPERFDVTYVGEDGGKHRPVMLHRVRLGSVDRFLGVLTEHFAGAFPFWLAPEQIRIMNITSDQEEYVKNIADKLKAHGFRVSTDLRNEKIGFKIREAQMQKVPHMLILGNQEMDEQKISVRLRSGDSKNSLDFLTYLDIVSSLDREKSLELWG